MGRILLDKGSNLISQQRNSFWLCKNSFPRRAHENKSLRCGNIFSSADFSFLFAEIFFLLFWGNIFSSGVPGKNFFGSLFFLPGEDFSWCTEILFSAAKIGFFGSTFWPKKEQHFGGGNWCYWCPKMGPEKDDFASYFSPHEKARKIAFVRVPPGISKNVLWEGLL